MIGGTTRSLATVSSAALLNDGRVLLASNFAAAPEIYDPVTNSCSPVTNWPPDFGASILSVLLDGRVLLDFPALFNPDDGTLIRLAAWGFDDDPAVALLPDRKVLVSGGNEDFGGVVNQAELFDAESGRFTLTGNMSSLRAGHTSILLPDGTVLLAGGVSTFNSATKAYLVTESTEIYDPAAGGFSPTGSMTMPRYSHASVLLNNGQVLITGGEPTSPPEGPVRSFVGASSAELYTPANLISAPMLFTAPGNRQTQGAIWHTSTGRIASPDNPAGEGEILSLYTTNLMSGALLPPRIAIGGRFGETLFFGPAPGYPGYFQINFRVPHGVAGSAVPVRLSYIGRWSNEVSMSVQ
jgi:hypothetical protein